MLLMILSEPSKGMPELAYLCTLGERRLGVTGVLFPGGSKQRHARVGSVHARRTESDMCLG
jgi:hypothetical protein